jgi:hypothetical protein
MDAATNAPNDGQQRIVYGQRQHQQRSGRIGRLAGTVIVD